MLFDLYRAIGQQHKFESLALDYAQQFGWSAPQWFSMPRMVADAASEERPARSQRIEGQVGWVCPEYLDADAVGQAVVAESADAAALGVRLERAEGHRAEACARLSELFRNWIPQKLDMRWLGGERLFAVLQEAAPTGVRDADPAYWLLRLDALRMTNRPDQFDEAAIDYCVTYEVSPPSWEPAQCKVRVSGSQIEHHVAAAVDGQRGVDQLCRIAPERGPGGQVQVASGGAVRPAGRRHRPDPQEAASRTRRGRPWSMSTARG